ncbi:MAG: glucose-phosphate cytidylyltransferase [Bacillales bacterium]|jgi:glucose-1-phosphate cytidylyltransferase|nr:glucose-phosphate cytidylyltransferase [Bacillales bacterium]
MKVVILAGGFGTRISEESHLKPKPMVEIGDNPILWHIMKIYSSYGFNDFVICLGYKGVIIKEYFDHYYLNHSDVQYNFSGTSVSRNILNTSAESWNVTLADTGLNTMTGGRIKRISKYLNNEPFLLTYGDGVSNIPIDKLVEFHKSHGKKVTVSAVNPAGRYGSISVGNNGEVTGFMEKKIGGDGLISAGFFVCEPSVIEEIEDDLTVWETGPMERLTRQGEVRAYMHNDFFASMDTQRDQMQLNEIWKKGKAPWKVWK